MALRDADVPLEAGRLPALGRILPELGLEAPGRDFEELEVLEALVAVATRHAPLALLLDDVHEADRQTLAALGYLRRRGAGAGVALVTTARRNEIPPDHPLNLLAPDTLIRLEPLSPSELAPLGIPRLHETTGGNPRFIAEALAGGRPRGVSRPLTEALLAQCRAAGAWAHRVLGAASVLEQPFEPGRLAGLLGADPTELTEELERLCEQRILRVDGLGFRFRYDLVRRVLLESVSPARRLLLQQRLDGLRRVRRDARPLSLHTASRQVEARPLTS
jgi:hypothetical protein